MPEFICPHCDQPFVVSDQNMGTTVNCPTCEAEITIPKAPAAPPPLPLRPLPPQHAAPQKNNSLATCGIALLFVTFGLPFIMAIIGVLAAILLPALARARESARLATCQNALVDQWKAFENDGEDLYPFLSGTPGRLMFEGRALDPAFPLPGDILRCPSDPDPGETISEPDDPDLRVIDDASYVYLGYVVTSLEEMASFADAYADAFKFDRDFRESLPTVDGMGSFGGAGFVRLNPDLTDDLARTDITVNDDEQFLASIPVMWDRPDNHIPPGGNVLYLDGHVEFVPMGEKWPMTEAAWEVIADMDALEE
jgi:prepilin-type processing-associated H-X9-DG protein